MKFEIFTNWVWPQTGILIAASGAWRFIDIGPVQIRVRMR